MNLLNNHQGNKKKSRELQDVVIIFKLFINDEDKSNLTYTPLVADYTNSECFYALLQVV